jgi:hypothetical protein
MRLQKRRPLRVDVRVAGWSMRGRNGLGTTRCAEGVLEVRVV